MANGALLGGLLKGFGAAQAAQQAREFQAEQTGKAQRLSILQAAATNPNLNPTDLPGIFQQMGEIYAPGGGKKGKGRAASSPAAPNAAPAAPASSAPAAPAPAPAAPAAAAAQPPAPPSFLSRVGSGIEGAMGDIGSRLRRGVQGARAAETSVTPPMPPMEFLAPGTNQTAAQAKLFAEKQRENDAAIQARTQQADALPDLSGPARETFILTGKLPESYGGGTVHPIGKPVPIEQVDPNAVGIDGKRFDRSSAPPGTPVQQTLFPDGSVVATVVARPQLSPSSISGQIQSAYETLQNSGASPAQKHAAVLTIQHYDPTRVRTDATTHISTITNPDGSTFQVAIPVTNTSTTSAPVPAGGQIPPARRSATPPAPPATLQGAQGSHTSPATPIQGTAGHKALPAIAQRGVTGAVEMNKLSNTIQQTILQLVPDAAQRNQLSDRLRGFNASLKYRTGFSSGELMDRINNLGAIMEIVGTTAIAQGRISNQQIEILKRHVPDADMTPALVLSRAKLAQFVANEVLTTLGATYGVGINPQTGAETPINESPGAVGSGAAGGTSGGGMLTPADIQAIAAHAKGAGGH